MNKGKILKMTKKKYIEFYSVLTGHSKSYVERNLLQKHNGGYDFMAGMQRYSAWILEGKIYCQHFLHGDCQGAWYFSYEGYGVDWNLIDRDRDEHKKQVIEDYIDFNDIYTKK
jgi:hypothetical protein